MKNTGKFVAWLKQCWNVIRERPVLFSVITLIQLTIWAAIIYGVYSICRGNYISAICCGAYIGGFIAMARAAAAACNRMVARKIGDIVSETIKSGNYATASL